MNAAFAFTGLTASGTLLTSAEIALWPPTKCVSHVDSIFSRCAAGSAMSSSASVLLGVAAIMNCSSARVGSPIASSWFANASWFAMKNGVLTCSQFHW